MGRALYRARRYEEAKKELELVAGEQGQLVDLFHLAKCHEQLGGIEEARKLYLTIETRDTKAGDQVGGPWAQAARSARRAMAWIQDRGGWKPSITLESAAPAKNGAAKRP